MHPPPPPQPPAPQPVYHPPTMENGGYSPGKQSSPAVIFCLNLTHNLTQLFIGGVIVSSLLLPNIYTFSDSFVQHIILCTVGYFILMTQAILAFSPFGCATSLKYETKRLLHAGIQICGAVLAIVGSIIRIVDRETNFETAHGICGLIAMILAFCNLLGGVLTLILPKMNSNLIKILHSFIGAATLSVAFISVIFAFHNYYRDVAGDRNANMAIVVAVLALAGTLLMTMVRTVKRILDK